MQFPQNPFGFGIRATTTPYLSEIEEFQHTKNRSYTQLNSGDGENFYQEANLGGVQLLRETLTAGTHIQAAPPVRFLPFAAALPSTGDYRFCGKTHSKNRLLQATGSEWDICFDQRLDYTGCVFDHDSLNLDYLRLHQRDMPEQWLISRAICIDGKTLNDYTRGVTLLMELLTRQPEIFNNTNSCKFIAAQATQVAINTLHQAQTSQQTPSPFSRRIRGVYRVIDYLQAFSAQLPSIADLCAIADLSERSLEYGFREHLGITPVRYLKIVRLNGARKTLLNPQLTTNVSNAAMDWGFLELGRFSRDYRQLFNELPSETLQKFG